MAGLFERNDKDSVGVLSCYDRVIITGTLPGSGHSEGMTSYLRANGIRIFDYAKFAEPLRDQIRKSAERQAEQDSIEIHLRRRGSIRKETVVQCITGGTYCVAFEVRTLRHLRRTNQIWIGGK